MIRHSNSVLNNVTLKTSALLLGKEHIKDLRIEKDDFPGRTLYCFRSEFMNHTKDKGGETVPRPQTLQTLASALGVEL